MSVLEAQAAISTTIETAMHQLQPDEVNILKTWLSDYAYKLWDEQIAADLDSGKLDAFLEEMEKEYQQGLVKPL